MNKTINIDCIQKTNNFSNVGHVMNDAYFLYNICRMNNSRFGLGLCQSNKSCYGILFWWKLRVPQAAIMFRFMKIETKHQTIRFIHCISQKRNICKNQNWAPNIERNGNLRYNNNDKEQLEKKNIWMLCRQLEQFFQIIWWQSVCTWFTFVASTFIEQWKYGWKQYFRNVTIDMINLCYFKWSFLFNSLKRNSSCIGKTISVNI